MGPRPTGIVFTHAHLYLTLRGLSTDEGGAHLRGARDGGEIFMPMEEPFYRFPRRDATGQFGTSLDDLTSADAVKRLFHAVRQLGRVRHSPACLEAG